MSLVDWIELEAEPGRKRPGKRIGGRADRPAPILLAEGDRGLRRDRLALLIDPNLRKPSGWREVRRIDLTVARLVGVEASRCDVHVEAEAAADIGGEAAVGSEIDIAVGEEGIVVLLEIRRPVADVRGIVEVARRQASRRGDEIQSSGIVGKRAPCCGFPRRRCGSPRSRPSADSR